MKNHISEYKYRLWIAILQNKEMLVKHKISSITYVLREKLIEVMWCLCIPNKKSYSLSKKKNICADENAEWQASLSH